MWRSFWFGPFDGWVFVGLSNRLHFRVLVFRVWALIWPFFDLGRLGGDRLSHALRRSTIGAGGFHVRVRDGIGCLTSAVATKPSKIKGAIMGAYPGEAFGGLCPGVCPGVSAQVFCVRSIGFFLASPSSWRSLLGPLGAFLAVWTAFSFRRGFFPFGVLPLHERRVAMKER